MNVSCAISKISIGWGTPIVFIPLESNEIIDDLFDGISHPVTLPIKGEYNDYGSIEDYELDINTEIIEKYFQVKFPKWLSSIEQSMIIHQKIYDILVWIGESNHRYKGFENELEEYKEKLKYYYDLCNNLEGIEVYTLANQCEFALWIRNYETFNKIYQPKILTGLIDNQLIEFNKFQNGLRMVGGYYIFNVHSAPQHGNTSAEKIFFSECLRIVDAKIAEDK